MVFRGLHALVLCGGGQYLSAALDNIKLRQLGTLLPQIKSTPHQTTESRGRPAAALWIGAMCQYQVQDSIKPPWLIAVVSTSPATTALLGPQPRHTKSLLRHL